jgi:hypothetical protein
MRRKFLKCLLVVTLVCMLSAASAVAITWFRKEIECPICKTKNTFFVVGSYGSYIYQDESKFQFVFWPHTASRSFYSCKQCRLTALMGDFEQTPKDKHTEILKQLEGVKFELREDKESKLVDEYYKSAVYLKIPVSQRLLAAQKVYEVVGRGDEFWCHFYRVLGYHFEAEKQQKEADDSRRKALALAEKMLADKANAEKRKELLLISGAMRHFLKDDSGALKDFNEALPLKYWDQALKKENNENYDTYLSDLLRQYVKMIQTPGGQQPQKKTP